MPKEFASAMSGKRDSNPLPTAWEAVALPGELLPLVQTEVSNNYKIYKLGGGHFN
jgi:hypothetical protein